MAVKTKLATGGLAALLIAAASGALAQADTLRVRLNADIRSTDPGVNRDANTDTVVLHVVEGLVAFKEDTSVGPLLAETVDVAEDGRTYTFTLREGVRFHNGEPLTADDVVRAWTRYLDPATNWRCLTEFDGRGLAKITSVTAKDARTVAFTLEKPSALFLTTMARADCGGSGIYHRASLDGEGKWKEPVGTGPFRLGEWRRGQFVELLRNDVYAARAGARDGLTGGKAPKVAKVRFTVIPDSSAAKAALLSGSIDVVADVSATDLPEYKARPDITLDTAASMDLVAFLLQTKDPLLQDVRVRRAFALALDVPEIVAAVTEGQAKPNRSPIPPPSSYYGPAQGVVPTRDVAAAKKLLAEAGYKGETIRLIATKRYPSLFDAAVLAQAQAQEAGLKLEIEVLDWATQLDRYTKGEYQAMSFTYSSRLDPSLSFEMFTGPKATQARKAWDDPQVQAKLAESMRVTDRVQRQAIFDDLTQRLIADVPIVALYSSIDTAAVRKNVVGYKGWAVGQPRLWGVEIKAGS